MVKKLMAILLILSFSSVYASAPQAELNSLAKSFDALNYSLTVEWDQKDTKFYNQSLDAFKAEIEKLQAQGLSNKELIDFAKTQIKSKKLVQDLDGLLGVIEANKLKPNEARQFVLENIAKNYSEGTSWAGDVFVVAGVIALIVVLALIIAAADTSVSTSSSYGSTCYDDYVCVDYYDSWGWYLYQDCYWQTYCY